MKLDFFKGQRVRKSSIATLNECNVKSEQSTQWARFLCQLRIHWLLFGTTVSWIGVVTERAVLEGSLTMSFHFSSCTNDYLKSHTVCWMLDRSFRLKHFGQYYQVASQREVDSASTLQHNTYPDRSRLSARPSPGSRRTSAS